MDIFTALADSRRRRLIETLHSQGPQSIKQLSAGHQISRQAVTKHLNLLIKAKVVDAHFVGKERVHSLNPKAIQRLTDWLAPFAENWDARFNKLRIHLGENDE